MGLPRCARRGFGYQPRSELGLDQTSGSGGLAWRREVECDCRSQKRAVVRHCFSGGWHKATVDGMVSSSTCQYAIVAVRGGPARRTTGDSSRRRLRAKPHRQRTRAALQMTWHSWSKRLVESVGPRGGERHRGGCRVWALVYKCRVSLPVLCKDQK